MANAITLGHYRDILYIWLTLNDEPLGDFCAQVYNILLNNPHIIRRNLQMANVAIFYSENDQLNLKISGSQQDILANVTHMQQIPTFIFYRENNIVKIEEADEQLSHHHFTAIRDNIKNIIP